MSLLNNYTVSVIDGQEVMVFQAWGVNKLNFGIFSIFSKDVEIFLINARISKLKSRFICLGVRVFLDFLFFQKFMMP